MPAILLLIALLGAGHIKTGEACRQKIDLCFLLDGSSTVCGGNEPCQNWKSALQFSKSITNTLKIGPKKDRVAFATFFNITEVNWNLRQYTSRNPLLSAIGRVAFKGGVYGDVRSAGVIGTDIFSPAAGDDNPKSGRPNVILMITDGVPSVDEASAEATALKMQKAGITFFVICVTPKCTERWARSAASKPEKPGLKTHFYVESYSSLNNALRDTVLKQICYFLEPRT